MKTIERLTEDIIKHAMQPPHLPSTMVVAYWLIGRAISEEINNSNQDGKETLKRVSDYLMPRYGRNFSIRTLQFARKLYKLYPSRVSIINPLSDEWIHEFPENLSWSHYRTITRLEDETTRKKIESEAIKMNWSKKQLKRHCHSISQ
jgi:hypothetical protein